jgi:nitroreductase
MISIYESRFGTADPTVLWAKDTLKRYRMNVAEGMGVFPEDELSSRAPVRTSIRRFRKEAIPDSTLAKVLDAAMWAPSSCNRQPCRFLVARNRDLIRRIGSSLVGGTGFADKAPVIIVVLVDLRMYSMPADQHLPYLDAGAAIMNMLSTVHSLGLGGCWMNWRLKRKARGIVSLLGLGRYMVPISAIALGRPEFIPLPPSRPTSKSVTRFL